MLSSLKFFRLQSFCIDLSEILRPSKLSECRLLRFDRVITPVLEISVQKSSLSLSKFRNPVAMYRSPRSLYQLIIIYMYSIRYSTAPQVEFNEVQFRKLENTLVSDSSFPQFNMFQFG